MSGGGKSRKSGGVSLRLIQQIANETKGKKSGEKKQSDARKRKSLFGGTGTDESSS